MSHLYNNYVEGNSGSGNGSNVRKGSNLYIEKNHYASLSQAVFYGDDGKATIIGNKYDGCGTLMSSGCGSKTMRIQINSGTTFTTADTSYVKIDSLTAVGSFKPSDYYSYTTDAVTDVKDIVTTWAGVGKISTTEYEQNVVTPSSSSSSTVAILSETAINTRVYAFVQNGAIVIQAEKGTKLRLFNPLGSLLYVGTATEAETVLALNVTQGTYLLQIGKHTQKILIK